MDGVPSREEGRAARRTVLEGIVRSERGSVQMPHQGPYDTALHPSLLKSDAVAYEGIHVGSHRLGVTMVADIKVAEI